MISLMSVTSHQSGLCEWKCSTCQHTWEAQHPFSGCPTCRPKDEEEHQIIHEDSVTIENIMATEQIREGSASTGHVVRNS